MKKVYNRWLRPIAIAVISSLMTAAILAIWPDLSFRITHQKALSDKLLLSLVLLTASIIILLAVLAFEIRSFLKEVIEKRRHTKERFGSEAISRMRKYFTKI